MFINEAIIYNFRKFENIVSFDFSDEMVFVGKNNSGKTSLSELFSKFLSPLNPFTFEDFNKDRKSVV